MYGYYGQGYGYAPYYGAQTQPQMQQQAPQMAQAQQPSGGDERIYVQGENAAKAYLVAPGNTVTLWDTERQSIYIKTVNAAGLPTTQRLDYTFAESAPQKTVSEYEDRIKAIETSIDKLKKRINMYEVLRNEHESDRDDKGV